MTTTTRDVSASGRELAVVEGFVYRRWERPAAGGGYTYATGAGLDVVAKRSGEGWVLRDRVTGIYGHGATPWDAARDFRTALREHLDVLERQPALSDVLQSQLEYLRDRA